MNTSTCRSCNKPILWAVTSNGSKIPLDPEPDFSGNIVVENGVATVISKADLGPLFGDDLPLYTSHFATCPFAAKHRKKK